MGFGVVENMLEPLGVKSISPPPMPPQLPCWHRAHRPIPDRYHPAHRMPSISFRLSEPGRSAAISATRLINRLCVEACNEHGWEIPFDQITVHGSAQPSDIPTRERPPEAG